MKLIEEKKRQDLIEAKATLIKCRAIKELLNDNDFACMIEIAGMSLGICDNEKMIPVIDNEIEEIQKFLEGKPNKWE